MQDQILNLIAVSQKALVHNVVQTQHGSFLRAGGHQFQSFWTRDFCFASIGLTRLGFSEVTKNHLNFLIHNRNSENLIPRGLDIYNPKLRVLRHTIFKFIPEKAKNTYEGQFYFEWKGEHGTISMDSNLLTLIYAIKYVEEINDLEFKNKNFPVLESILNFYKPYFSDGLLFQDKYSDWQDSVTRIGETAYLNLLYLIAMKLIAKHNIFSVSDTDIQNFEKKYLETFLQNDLLISLKDGIEVSLDANLLAIDFEVFDLEILNRIYSALKKHPVWIESLPGKCTFPEYPLSFKSLPTQLVGLLNYHDKMIWSWLVGCSLRVSAKMNDVVQVKKTLSTLNQIASRDKTIYEIYQVDADHKAFQTWIYNSESPFSWGAGQLGESLKSLTSKYSNLFS